MAETVLVYRSRARGKNSGYGKDPKQGGRYWEKMPESLPGLNQWHVPQGLVSADVNLPALSRVNTTAAQQKAKGNPTSDRWLEGATTKDARSYRDVRGVK